MKRSLLLLVVFLVLSLLSGCILSKTPNTNEVTIPCGEQMTFSVKVFPSNATYSWNLDGTLLPNIGNEYVYTAHGGDHFLIVRASHFFGTSTQTWHIITNPCDPISELLNTLVSIPSGTFQMGSEEDPWSTPVHAVTLQGFEIGAFEVTQAQYEAIMGVNPSHFQGADKLNNPVEQVSWHAAREFCTRLSALTGRTFTLPSEAQWEYACRAGSTTRYSYGDDDTLIGNYAWFYGNSENNGIPYGPHPVGTKLPNAWGIYDMHGNALEWCLDSWHDSYTGAPTDGSAWDPDVSAEKCVLRGCCYGGMVSCCRSAFRNWFWSGGIDPGVGFRVVAVPAGD